MGIIPDSFSEKEKKIPKELAIIQADNCTGCEACLEVCPVDCIFQIKQGVKRLIRR